MNAFVHSKALRPIAYIAVLFGLAGCAFFRGEDFIKPSQATLERPFSHGVMTIIGWESPPIRDGAVVAQTKLRIRNSDGRGLRTVSLNKGDRYEGVSIAQADARPDTIGDRSKGLAAVITTDISLELEPPTPSKYLILRDVSGYAIAFYSDVPHPPMPR